MAADAARDPWTRRFDVVFKTTPGPLTRAIRRTGFGTAEELCVVGRRTGTERRLLVTAIEDGGQWYVGHPNGDAAHWVRNLAAADVATMRTRRSGDLRVRPHLLEDGPDRDRAIDLIVGGVPFPISIMYRRGREHLRAVGSFFRLEPIPPAANPGEAG